MYLNDVTKYNVKAMHQICNHVVMCAFQTSYFNDTQGLSRHSEVEDINGKRMSAITIFSMAINYMWEHLMAALQKQVPDIEQSDVMFVITVPAIWSDASKQFMREAAVAVRVVLIMN